jgi:hypothetical protein
MKLELECQDNYVYGETFYTIYIFFLHKYYTEKPTIQAYISPSQFSTVTENMKQISEWRIRTPFSAKAKNYDLYLLSPIYVFLILPN